MKHIGGRFGSMAVLDLTGHVYAVQCKGSDEVLRFADIDRVIDAGWAVD